MKNNEAIRMLVRLKDCINFEVTDAQKKMDALNMAIKALEKQNCKDAISREEAIKWMENIRTLNKYYHPKEDDDETLVSEVISRLKQVPTVTPQPEIRRVIPMETIDVHEMKATDKDYPALIMRLVPKAEQYTLFSINGMTVVPLFQILDAIMVIKPDTIRRNGIEYCANCGAKIKTDKESKG